MSKILSIRPRISEKSYGLSKNQRTYVFEVPMSANRQSIAAAVNVQFGVTVEDVNIAIAKGKVKRSVRKGSRPTLGKRNDVKKAYVKLKTGDSIPVFEGLVDSNTEEKKEKK